MAYRYHVSCWKCKANYAVECTSEQFDKIKCPECKAKKQGWKTMKTINTQRAKTANKSAYIIGTTSKMDNFDYRAKVNMSRAEGERRAAEKLSGSTVSPYQDYYDQSGLDEGIHDNENGIVL